MSVDLLERHPDELFPDAAGGDRAALDMFEGRTVLHEVVDAQLMDMGPGNFSVKKLFLEKEKAVDLQFCADLFPDLPDHGFLGRLVEMDSAADCVVVGFLIVVHEKELSLMDDDRPDPVIEGSAIHGECQIYDVIHNQYSLFCIFLYLQEGAVRP